MSIWKKHYGIGELNRLCADCAVAYLGIEFTAQGEDYLAATMPVDCRTTQPMGLLHGGMSVALAETVGSLAGFCCVEEGKAVVGVEVNANHLRPVRTGPITAIAKPVRLGANLQVWQIDIRDPQDKLCCISRLTLSVVNS